MPFPCFSFDHRAKLHIYNKKKKAVNLCLMHLAVSLIALLNWRAGLLGTLLSLCQKKTNPAIHRSSINTLSEKDTIQETLIKQSLVIWRILCIADVRLMFNTIIKKKRTILTRNKWMVALCRLRTENVACLAKQKTAHSISCKPDPTDHRASSLHFDLLFIRMYRCALLEQRRAHQSVESDTSKPTVACFRHDDAR